MLPAIEQALRDSEERFRLLVDGDTGYAIYMLDPRGKIVSWNAGAERLKGYSADEILGRDFSVFYTGEDAAEGKAGSDLARAAAEGRFEQEAIRVRKDGSRFWARIVLSALRSESGELRGFAKVTCDITDRIVAAQRLTHANDVLATTFANIQEGVLVADATGKLVLFNPTATQILGAGRLGQHASDWVRLPGAFEADGLTPLPVDQVPLTRALRGEVLTEERLFIHEPEANQGRMLSVTAAPLRDTAGTITGALATFRDVTPQMRADEILKNHTRKLEQSNRELESFAAVASHDLQEPLRKIRAFGDLLSTRYGERLETEGKDYLARMRSAAGRMQALIENLLAFSRVSTKPTPLTAVDLGQIAREVASDLDGRLLETRGLLELGALPTLEADPTQIRQLLQNLFGNALKFHRANATPIVTVSSKLLPAPPFGGDPSWEIRINDNGVGFEPQYAERIFGIFQRLHGRGEFEGTGIGLAICRRIVERHQGTIVAEGVPGVGATFVITLPSRQTAAPGGRA